MGKTEMLQKKIKVLEEENARLRKYESATAQSYLDFQRREKEELREKLQECSKILQELQAMRYQLKKSGLNVLSREFEMPLYKIIIQRIKRRFKRE